MDEKDFYNKTINSNHINRLHVQIPERDKLLFYLQNLSLFTGQQKIMYCNLFLDEAINLLINSIFLYEDGLFDCAFYSLRQASEVTNNMFYLSKKDRKTLSNWALKENFPMNNELKRRLEKLSEDYKEIKSLIPEYFDHHTELINKSNKIIHKQGFDTFYNLRDQVPNKFGFSQEKETSLFIESLKYTIGILLILFIILEPISLALSDEEVDSKLNFNFITEPIDVDYFNKFLGLDDIVDKIKNSNFYKNYISNFSDKESMSPAVYFVVREEAWDIDALDEIEKQLHLLDFYEIFMFYILKSGIRVSTFYFCSGLTWYYTSIKCNYQRLEYGGEEFKEYLESDNKFNQPCKNVFMSVILMFKEPLFIEHNEKLTSDEIQVLIKLESEGIKLSNEFDKSLTNFKNI